MSPDMLRAAQWYANRFRWHVFPCRGKKPITPHGCKDASTDPRVIAGMWGRSNYSIGVTCGPSSLAMVDIDGPTGAEALATLEAQHGALPVTPTVITRHGRHFYFAAGEHQIGNSVSKLGPKVDTRAGNGYGMLPPSVHPTGFVYRWAPGLGPHEIELAPLPEWIAEALGPEPEPEPVELPPDGPNRVRWANVALAREANKVRTCAPGARNRQLRNSAWALGTLCGAGVLDPRLARGALIAAGIECGLPMKEAVKVANRGVTQGMQKPRAIHG